MAWVQDDTSLNDAPGPTIAQAFGSNVTQASLILTWAGWSDTDGTPTCSDNINGAHTAYGKLFDGVSLQGHCAFFFPNAGAGATTVTVTFPDSVQYRRIGIAEYSNIATVAPQDGTTLRVQSSTTTPSSGAITTTQNGDTVFANIQNVDEGGSGTGTVSASGAYTERQQLGTWIGSMEDQVQASAGSIDGTWTLDAAKRCICHIMAMKAQPPAPPGTRAFAPGLAR